MDQKQLGNYTVLLLLTFVVAASGCISGDQNQQPEDQADQTLQEAEELQACSGVSLRIIDASAPSAFIQQTSGDSGVGQVEVTWTLENGQTATDTVALESTRDSAQAQSGLSGTLKGVVAKAVECRGTPTATYP